MVVMAIIAEVLMKVVGALEVSSSPALSLALPTLRDV